ncbi:hypothetical protein F383_31770 [Gossypium arboreum]|uniref:Uncharacterized protein n=1 Tax=Gossypium arboreum TaxID=29729 RepID=A0A0B0PGZ8_GOSAR|nr:hypothetical protein F383_31770 [Gossypium arboreum]
MAYFIFINITYHLLITINVYSLSILNFIHTLNIPESNIHFICSFIS